MRSERDTESHDEFAMSAIWYTYNREIQPSAESYMRTWKGRSKVMAASGGLWRCGLAILAYGT
jgi:hypothetical protein